MAQSQNESVQAKELKNLYSFHNALKLQLETFGQLLCNSTKSEIIGALLDAIRLVIGQNENSVKMQSESDSSSSNNTTQLEQTQKVHDSIKDIIKVFRIIHQTQQDPTLALILSKLNSVVENYSVPFSISTASINLTASASKEENENASSTKRHKVEDNNPQTKLEESEKSKMGKTLEKDMDSKSMEIDIKNENQNQSKTAKGESEQINVDDISSEAVVKALRNPMILTKIFRKMKTRDLVRNCRLVNREWCDLSTDVLVKRDNLQFRLKNYYWAARDYFPKVTEILTSSRKLPTVNFGIDGTFKTKIAQSFLSEFGNRMKGVKLGSKFDSKVVRTLLFEQLPHLERLQLKNVVADGPLQISKSKSESSPAPRLSSLTSLELFGGNSLSLVTDIVAQAPNLQDCKGIWTVPEIELLLPRIHILKGLILKPKSADVKAFEVLIEMDLKLNYFDMDYSDVYTDEFPMFDKINSKILSSSQNTLEEIKFAPSYKNEIQWPMLEKVEKLTLSGSSGGLRDLFESPNISEKFLNLHTLCFMSSESLRLFGIRPEIIPEWYKLSPNITHLDVDLIEDFPKVAPKIWGMVGLKSLRLKFSTLSTAKIDAGFTGMEKTTCKFLRTSGRGKMEMSEAKKFQVHPSIVNLKELQELELPDGFQEKLDENEIYNEDEEKFVGASFVSFKYAFNLMSRLRVVS